MRIYITGATGFVGSEVVDAAVRRGHEIVGVVRSSSTATAGSPESAESVSVAQVDLRSPRGLVESLAGVDLVIHLAAAKAGDFYTQFAGTVIATENLLAAMAEAGVTDLVGISTFSVYDYMGMKAGSVLDEMSPTDDSPALRDEYTRTKLLQEGLYRDFGANPDHRLVILRPGMIYGAENLWHSLLGAELGPKYLKVGGRSTLPMSYVENCAEAIVLAAERVIEPDSPVDGQVLNIVDDNLPTQSEYADAVSARMDTPSCISIPWPALRTAAALLSKANKVAVGGRAKFPGIAVPERLHARFKTFEFPNAKAKRLLDWTPRYDMATAIDRSIAVQNASERLA